MAIDINKLTEPELVDLNNRIVARLRFLQQMRAHASMLEFSLGERVSFQPEGHPVLFGVITKYNRKSVTVITETGQHWTVAPSFLRKIKPVREAESDGGNVILRLRSFWTVAGSGEVRLNAGVKYSPTLVRSCHSA